MSVTSVIMPLKTFLALDSIGFSDKIMSCGFMKMLVSPCLWLVISICTPLPISTIVDPSFVSEAVPLNVLRSAAKLAMFLDSFPKISVGSPISVIFPSFMSAMRWGRVLAWNMLCVAITIVSLLWRFAASITSSIISAFLGSKFDVGSSRRRSLLSRTKALAMATLCCSPPESFLAGRFSKPSSLTSLRALLTDLSSSSFETFLILRPYAMLL